MSTVMKFPYANIGMPDFFASANGVPGAIPSLSGRYRLLKSGQPIILAITGITRSAITESIIVLNAPPIITPTARSMTFPLMANSLNSLTNPILLILAVTILTHPGEFSHV